MFWSMEALGSGIRQLWTWDFYLVTVLAILAPLVYQVRVLIRSPWRIADVYGAIYSRMPVGHPLGCLGGGIVHSE